MPNQQFRDRLRARVELAVAYARSAAALEHTGVKGAIREIAVRELIHPTLPAGFSIGTGLVTDKHGAVSGQMDTVIYDPRRIAPLLDDERHGQFPVESCVCTIEIKSVLTAQELNHALSGARSVADLALGRPQSDHVVDFGWPPELDAFNKLARVIEAAKQPPPQSQVLRSLFAFDSDLTGDGKSELDRYFEKDSLSFDNPGIHLLCVAGRGFWRFIPDEHAWAASPPTEEHDEVMDFLGVIANSVGPIAAARARAALGEYIILPRPFEKVDRNGFRTHMAG